jgi:tetratricopeptide (TPR) repeat protein
LLLDNLTAYTNLDDETKKLKVRGDDLFSSGIAMEQQQRYEEAMQQYKETLKCFQKINDKPKTGLTHIYLGDIYRKTKQYSLARDSYSEGLTVYVETGDEEKKALSLSSLGITYYLLGEYFDALDFLQRSLKTYQSLKDKDSEEKVKKNIRLIEARIENKKQGK